MNLTSNFDFCVELGIDPVRAIFHLALKNEALFPHNIGPFARVFSGRTMDISVRLLDDIDAAADLSFADDKHIRFSIPFELTASVPDAPDPALSEVTLKVVAGIPGALASWPVEGNDQLGIDFTAVAAAAVSIDSLAGLPSIDAGNFTAALHSKYDSLEHRYTLADNELLLYDGNRDLTLDPPNAATPFEIEAALEAHAGTEYVKVRLPIHVSVPTAFYQSYGRIVFWRAVERTGTTITVNMAAEPAAAALATTVELDAASPAKDLIIANLTPLARNALAGFGTITEPGFDETAARQLLRDEIAAYINVRRFPIYTPESGDEEEPLATPVGFLLPADGVLAILMNRRDGSVSDFAPDNFLGSSQLALAVGRAKVDEIIAAAIDEEFPGVNDGGHEVSTEEGSATLYTLSVVPADAGSHDEAEGHLWVSGTAEVHIDCWPDPDVSFDGPIFLRVALTETPTECTMEIQPQVGDFDFDQSCCDVFIDLIIPIVGWIMLAIIESTIDEVGGELAEEIAGGQGRAIQPIPPVVQGVAELQACLEDLSVGADGFVFPGKLRIRREGTSFEDLQGSGNLPRP
ncbi:MAG: hypothetical protein IT531_16190 [Burkholderiales bacterium]|nr:hypothetical protein [Burkholderiales bacterium]